MNYSPKESTLTQHQLRIFGEKGIRNMCCHRAKENVCNVGSLAVWMLEFMALWNCDQCFHMASFISCTMSQYIVTDTTISN